MHHEPTSRSRPGWWLVAAGTSLLLALAACGGDGSDETVPSGDGDTAAAGGDGGEAAEDREEELLDWVACMRDQGVDIPDPEVDADGNLGFPDGLQITGGPGAASPQDAQEACGPPPPRPGGGGERMDRSEVEDTMLEYAQCMRDHGVDMPDPQVNEDGGVIIGGGPGGGGGGGGGPLDPNDPAFQDAQTACQDILSGLPGGGPGAGG